MPTIFAAAVLLSALAGSALADGQAGQAGAFLRQEPGARGAALGGAMTAIVDDASSLIWNPAGLARMVKPEIGATHVTLFEDTNYDFFSGGYPTRRFGGFAAAYVNQGSGGFQARQGPNDAPSSFSIGQNAFLAGWGLALPGLPIDAGATFKLARETIDNTSASGAGADVGLAYHPDPRLQLGVSVQNIVPPRLTFVSEPVQYARAVDASVGSLWRLAEDWSVLGAWRLSRVDGQSLSSSEGVELRYGSLAALRVGMQDKGWAMGVGLKVGNTSVDYAAMVGDLGLSNLISLTQRFGQTKEELEETIRKGIGELTASDAGRLAKAYVRKADAELDAGRVGDALHDLESASLLDPSNDEIHERIRVAGEQWEQSLKRQMIERTAALAASQQDQGNLIASRQYWLSVLELDPGHADAKQALARIDNALSNDERAKLDAARREAEDAQEKQSLAVAQSLRDQGRLREALVSARQSLERRPDSRGLRDFEAQTRKQIDDFDADRAAEAERLAAAGDYAGALRAAAQALREKPGDDKLAGQAQGWRGQLQRKLSPDQRKEIEQLYYRAVDQYLKGNLSAAGELAKQVMQADPSWDAARELQDKVDAAQRYAK